MGKWISIYFRKAEYEKLKMVLKKEKRRKGREVSAYKLLKEWIMERLDREEI